jgi:hypothetical protein
MSAGESVGEFIDDPAGADLEGASNVLVLAPSLAAGARETYYERVLNVDPAERDVLAVQYSGSPREYLAEWERYRGAVPQRCGIVDVAEPRSGDDDATVDGATVARIDSPSDLTGIGMKVGAYLDRFGDADTLLTLDSLTLLLQYVDLERAFRFLHAIACQVREVGALAHYHVDPNAHDDRVLATLSELFDGVARFQDGDWETRRR